MDIIVQPSLSIVLIIAQFYKWTVIINVILSWLINLNIINYRNSIVNAVSTICYRLVEPVLIRIRKFLPDIAGIDFSPFVLLLLIHFFEMIIFRILIRLAY